MHQELINETLESMKDYVPKLVAASEKIAQDIQSHQGGWVDIFIAYSEGMVWLTQAISGIQQLDQQILKDWDVAALAPLISQLNIALEQEDFVSLCDLLEYEMKPLLLSYDDKLKRLVH
ncbi:hypothetical protein [Brevibacillus sp. H7]|uniref:hypothetical protein n=1 Tax=Brevibacillus sp. H7 TaxID=3349138 RepID=UPI0037FBF87D